MLDNEDVALWVILIIFLPPNLISRVDDKELKFGFVTINDTARVEILSEAPGQSLLLVILLHLFHL